MSGEMAAGGPLWRAGQCTSHWELQDRAVHGFSELLPLIHAYMLFEILQAAIAAVGLL